MVLQGLLQQQHTHIFTYIHTHHLHTHHRATAATDCPPRGPSGLAATVTHTYIIFTYIHTYHLHIHHRVTATTVSLVVLQGLLQQQHTSSAKTNCRIISHHPRRQKSTASQHPSLLLSWMFEHDCLNTRCFGCPIHVFVFLHLHLFSAIEHVSHGKVL